MPDYNNAKIYMVIDKTNGNVYYGSTTKKLSHRIRDHRNDYKRFLKGLYGYNRVFDIIKNDNYFYKKIQDFPCKNVHELRKQERLFIELCECVNKNVPGRTYNEWRQINMKSIIYKNKIRDSKRKVCPHCELEFTVGALRKHKQRFYQSLEENNFILY